MSRTSPAMQEKKKEDPSKEVLAVSKYLQHQTSLLESSAIPQVLHLPTEPESKVQTKLEMMLDETELMESFEILHFGVPM